MAADSVLANGVLIDTDKVAKSDDGTVVHRQVVSLEGEAFEKLLEILGDIRKEARITNALLCEIGRLDINEYQEIE